MRDILHSPQDACFWLPGAAGKLVVSVVTGCHPRAGAGVKGECSAESEILWFVTAMGLQGAMRAGGRALDMSGWLHGIWSAVAAMPELHAAVIA